MDKDTKKTKVKKEDNNKKEKDLYMAMEAPNCPENVSGTMKILME